MGLRCILKVLGASEEKLHALEGFVPPTHYAVWVGEPDYTIPGDMWCLLGHIIIFIAHHVQDGYIEKEKYMSDH